MIIGVATQPEKVVVFGFENDDESTLAALPLVLEHLAIWAGRAGLTELDHLIGVAAMAAWEYAPPPREDGPGTARRPSC